MNNLRIKTALAVLPYREMRELGKDMASALNDSTRHELFATALSGLVDAEASKEADSEQKILASCFNRKRSFTIQPFDSGFKIISMDSVVHTSNIREGISELLDRIVAIKVLE